MSRDLELMEFVDGEHTADGVEQGGDAAVKAAALRELGELVRGRLELAADEVPDARFDALWREIDKQIDRTHQSGAGQADMGSERTSDGGDPGLWHRLTRAIDRYRGHILVGAVSAGAVGALALLLRPATEVPGSTSTPMEVQTIGHRSAEIDDLNTPGGVGTVFYLNDEDGSTTVIWVTPEDTVEGI